MMNNNAHSACGAAFILMVGLAVILAAPPVAAIDKEICISFDELPASQSFEQASAAEIMRPIIDALERHEVKAVGFVVSQNIDGAFDLLGEWLNKSNRIGNQTYSFTDLHEVSIEGFLRDVMAGEEAIEPMLSGFGQQPRFFRYPFLHYGTTIEAQRATSMYFEENNIQVVPATVLVEDYLYNLSLEKLGRDLDSARYDLMLNEYVNHVLDQIEAAERQAVKMLGRNCRQILALRANRLNALFIEEMLTAIENLGYEFVSVDAALRDPVYERAHAYFGPRGVGYLDMIQQSNPDLLPAGE